VSGRPQSRAALHPPDSAARPFLVPGSRARRRQQFTPPKRHRSPANNTNQRRPSKRFSRYRSPHPWCATGLGNDVRLISRHRVRVSTKVMGTSTTSARPTVRHARSTWKVYPALATWELYGSRVSRRNSRSRRWRRPASCRDRGPGVAALDSSSRCLGQRPSCRRGRTASPGPGRLACRPRLPATPEVLGRVRAVGVHLADDVVAVLDAPGRSRRGRALPRPPCPRDCRALTRLVGSASSSASLPCRPGSVVGDQTCTSAIGRVDPVDDLRRFSASFTSGCHRTRRFVNVLRPFAAVGMGWSRRRSRARGAASPSGASGRVLLEF